MYFIFSVLLTGLQLLPLLAGDPLVLVVDASRRHDEPGQLGPTAGVEVSQHDLVPRHLGVGVRGLMSSLLNCPCANEALLGPPRFYYQLCRTRSTVPGDDDGK